MSFVPVSPQSKPRKLKASSAKVQAFKNQNEQKDQKETNEHKEHKDHKEHKKECKTAINITSATPSNTSIQLLIQSHQLEPIIKWCQAYLAQTRSHYPQNLNMTLLFDIDDTILFNTEKGFVVPEAMKQLYKIALELQYKICFVTARIHTPDNVAFTQKQLHDSGFGFYEHLYLMPEEFYQNHSNWSCYKTYARNLVAQTYEIVLNIGDNWGDVLLLEPFEGVFPGTKELLKTVGNKTYAIFRSPDISWFSVKLPTMSKK